MATSNGGDERSRKRFLPSIRNPVFNPSDEEGITVTLQPAKEEPQRNNGGSRRSLRQGIRKFFSSDRSARPSLHASNRSKDSAGDNNLPSLSPQPPSLTSTPPNLDDTRGRLCLNDPLRRSSPTNLDDTRGRLCPNDPLRRSSPTNLDDTRDSLSPNDPLRSRTHSLRNSARQRLISVTNLRGMTGGSRSVSPGSCVSSSSSCGSGLWTAEKLNTTASDAEITSSTTTNSNSENVDAEAVKQTESRQGDAKTDDVTRSGETVLQREKVIDIGALAGDPTESQPVVMFTNLFDLKREFKKAKAAKNYFRIVDFLTSAFNSLRSLAQVFKASEFDLKCGINAVFVNVTFDILMALPSDHRKTVLKSVVNCLLSNIKSCLRAAVLVCTVGGTGGLLPQGEVMSLKVEDLLGLASVEQPRALQQSSFNCH